MLTLSEEKRLKLLDLIECVVNRQAISLSLLNDYQVVYQFLFLSKDSPELVQSFLNLLVPDQWCDLTEQDVLTEEVMLELHLLYGFSDYDLAAWLRGLSYGGVEFFKQIANEQQVVRLDDIVFRSRYHAHMVKGVLVNELPQYFDSLVKLMDYALTKRISFKQYRIILGVLTPTDADALAQVRRLMNDYGALSKISRASEELPFSLLCGLLEFIPEKKQYLSGVYQVMDHYFDDYSIEKTAAFINGLPYAIIRQILDRYIANNEAPMLDHLNDTLPEFKYGTIRKIVRRNQLGVNYNHG